MAERRMISKRISRDKRVAQLTLASGLLYAFSIPHLDVDGRMDGSPIAVRGTIVRAYAERQPDLWTDQLVAAYMAEWEATHPLSLVGIYTVDDVTVAFFPGFTKNQRIVRDREAASRLPAPPPEVLVRLGLACDAPDSGATPASKTEDEVEVEVKAGTPTAVASCAAHGLPVAQTIDQALSPSGLHVSPADDPSPVRDLGRLAVSLDGLGERPAGDLVLPPDDLRAIAEALSDHDDGTVNVLRRLRRKLPEAAFHSALESLALRRQSSDKPPLQSEVRYFVSTLKTMEREGQYRTNHV